MRGGGGFVASCRSFASIAIYLGFAEFSRESDYIAGVLRLLHRISDRRASNGEKQAMQNNIPSPPRLSS